MDGKIGIMSDLVDSIAPANHSSQHNLKVLTFQLNQQLYAVSISDIKEVNRLTNLKQIPKHPAYVLGLINYHGETVFILFLKRYMNKKEIREKLLIFF